ncbi:hypothetical protein CJF30_00002366 [Rutstroemia sp. NJR-2017a BBW]|nr:hypothetical protein CJF30_00002366 [Rutstroemia sp. NJR-2017a BBW]
MATSPALHHSLLRPCVLHILRAAGYHSTRPSVLDTLTDLAARYMYLLAQSTAAHADLNHTELDITIQDVRMAMQDCGALMPEKVIEDQEFEGVEDMRGVEEFLSWATGEGNKEIRRIALGDGKEDYLTALKKKHSTTDEDSRYHGTLLGKPAEPRVVKVEGGEISSVKEWADRLKMVSKQATVTPSTREASSALSSVGDQVMENMDF